MHEEMQDRRLLRHGFPGRLFECLSCPLYAQRLGLDSLSYWHSPAQQPSPYHSLAPKHSPDSPQIVLCRVLNGSSVSGVLQAFLERLDQVGKYEHMEVTPETDLRLAAHQPEGMSVDMPHDDIMRVITKDGNSVDPFDVPVIVRPPPPCLQEGSWLVIIVWCKQHSICMPLHA